jgi:type II secretory pathway component PulF
MLVPFMLSLCVVPGHGEVARAMAQATMGTAALVAVVHTLATLLAGIVMAWVVYRYLGLQFLRRAWLNLDAVWGASLVVAGAAGIGLAV